MNTCVFIGRLTKDPETRQAGDTTVCDFNIAIDRGKSGADFPRIKAFGKEAENLAKFKKKGDLLGIQAHIRTGSYLKDGQTVYTQELIADRVEYLTKTETEPVPDPVAFGDFAF